MDSFDGGKVKERLRKLGEKYYRILRNIPVHQYYQGVGWNLEAGRVERAKRSPKLRRKRKPDIVNFIDFAENCFLTMPQEYAGEIVIDWSPLEHTRRVRIISSSSEDDNSDTEGDNNHRPIILDPKSRSEFRNISPNDYEELSTHHYFLFPRRVTGFAIGKKQRSKYALLFLILL